MRRILPLLLTVVGFIGFFIASERPALAYVDPGSGLLALQTTASIVAGFAFFLRRRLRALFGRGPVDSSTVPFRAVSVPKETQPRKVS
jgi:hypothetical protein